MTRRIPTFVVMLTAALAMAACAATEATPAADQTAPVTPSPGQGIGLEMIPSQPTGPEISADPVRAEDDDGEFRLTIEADQDRYRAGQPIEVHATLTYLGPAEVARAFGSGSGLVGFGLRHEELGIVIGSASTTDCRPYDLAREEPVEYPFAKSGGYSPDEPLAPFYEAYFADPELRLPAGTWTISAGAGFYTGADCGDVQHSLGASVTVVVEP